jgi:hypothetical protein
MQGVAAGLIGLRHPENIMTKLFTAIGLASVLIIVAKYGLVPG